MIGNCDCCDRENIPVSHFKPTFAYPEGVACYLCQGDTDPDPYGELEMIRIEIGGWHFIARQNADGSVTLLRRIKR